MKVRPARAGVFALVLALLFTGGYASGAYAGTEYGTIGLTAEHSGQKFRNRSVMITTATENKLYSIARITPRDFSVGTSILGANARAFFTINGALITSSGWWYNSSPYAAGTWFGNGVTKVIANGQSVYSRGQVRVKVGSTLYTYNTIKTDEAWT